MSVQSNIHEMTQEMLRGSATAEQAAMNGRWLDVIASTNNCFAAHVQILRQIAGIEQSVTAAAVVAMRQSLAELQQEIEGLGDSAATQVDDPGDNAGGQISRTPFSP